MILADASAIVSALRDRTGAAARKFEEYVGDRKVWVSRFTELELLAGARTEAEWRWLSTYLEGVGSCEPMPSTWRDAARIYFDLRRNGLTALIAALRRSRLTLRRP